MTVYNIEKLRTDYFEINKFQYKQYELPSMIEDYFDMNMGEDMTVVKPIIQLLRSLNRYLLILDERFYDSTTPAIYHEREKHLLEKLNEAQLALSQETAEHKKLLQGTIQYAHQAIAIAIQSFQLDNFERAGKIFLHSKLLALSNKGRSV